MMKRYGIRIPSPNSGTYIVQEFKFIGEGKDLSFFGPISFLTEAEAERYAKKHYSKFQIVTLTQEEYNPVR